MKTVNNLSIGEPLTSLPGADGRSWFLLGLGELPEGSCFIASVGANQDVCALGFFDGASGDVFPCEGPEGLPIRENGPAVHLIGSMEGATGQVTVRQEQGNFLRVCRWDRIDSDSSALPRAKLRTLPQCGCGGSLGAPKLFSSFAQMCAYHFCAFYLR